jgi:cell division protein ZipA
MLSSLSDAAILRLIIVIVFLVVIVFILYSGKRKKPVKPGAFRVEPVVPVEGDEISEIEQEAPIEQETFREQANLGFEEKKPEPASSSKIGKRKSESYEKLVMLYMAAKSGHTISGAELVLAAEKVGLIHGHHNIYHRLAETSASGEPVFSMANVIQPGYFDLDRIDTLTTPGVSFFLTLPGPVSAVQAWDSMLPIAERMAQLLDAVLLDSDRNALGRQRILHIKEELRAFDREKERQTIKPGR